MKIIFFIFKKLFLILKFKMIEKNIKKLFKKNNLYFFKTQFKKLFQTALDPPRSLGLRPFTKDEIHNNKRRRVTATITGIFAPKMKFLHPTR
jgi:hypothetical protein